MLLAWNRHTMCGILHGLCRSQHTRKGKAAHRAGDSQPCSVDWLFAAQWDSGIPGHWPWVLGRLLGCLLKQNTKDIRYYVKVLISPSEHLSRQSGVAAPGLPPQES